MRIRFSGFTETLLFRSVSLFKRKGYIDKGLFLHVTNKDLPFHGKRKRKTCRTVRLLRNNYATSRELFAAELRKLGISPNIKFM